jgi:hypothetical protein
MAPMTRVIYNGDSARVQMIQIVPYFAGHIRTSNGPGGPKVPQKFVRRGELALQDLLQVLWKVYRFGLRVMNKAEPLRAFCRRGAKAQSGKCENPTRTEASKPARREAFESSDSTSLVEESGSFQRVRRWESQLGRGGGNKPDYLDVSGVRRILREDPLEGGDQRLGGGPGGSCLAGGVPLWE